MTNYRWWKRSEILLATSIVSKKEDVDIKRQCFRQRIISIFTSEHEPLYFWLVWFRSSMLSQASIFRCSWLYNSLSAVLMNILSSRTGGWGSGPTRTVLVPVKSRPLLEWLLQQLVSSIKSMHASTVCVSPWILGRTIFCGIWNNWYNWE